jgi:hypothetical protein
MLEWVDEYHENFKLEQPVPEPRFKLEPSECISGILTTQTATYDTQNWGGSVVQSTVCRGSSRTVSWNICRAICSRRVLITEGKRVRPWIVSRPEMEYPRRIFEANVAFLLLDFSKLLLKFLTQVPSTDIFHDFLRSPLANVLYYSIVSHLCFLSHPSQFTVLFVLGRTIHGISKIPLNERRLNMSPETKLCDVYLLHTALDGSRIVLPPSPQRIYAYAVGSRWGGLGFPLEFRTLRQTKTEPFRGGSVKFGARQGTAVKCGVVFGICWIVQMDDCGHYCDKNPVCRVRGGCSLFMPNSASGNTNGKLREHVEEFCYIFSAYFHITLLCPCFSLYGSSFRASFIILL